MKIFSILILFMSFISLLPASEPLKSEESELFFNSHLFVDYHNQLKEFVHEPVSSEEVEFADFILNYQPESLKENKAFYSSMIDRFRALIKEEENSAFIDHFSTSLFESVQMWDSMADLQNTLFTSELPYSDPMNLFDLITLTKEIYAITLDDPDFNGCHKVSKETNDQMRFGNFPYALFHLDETLVLRIPCMAREEKGEVIITEEFAQYLKAIEKKGQKHLYVNLITQKYGKGESNDPKYRKEIEALEEKLPGTFFAATLDKNSPFYFQIGEFAEMDDAEEFKTTFAEHLFATSNPKYYWPSCLDQKEWKNFCLQLLDDIHFSYFQDQSEFSLDERKDYIHILYLEIVKELTKTLEVDSMNVSCVNTVDRGISLLAELYLDQIFQKSETISREEADRFTTLTLVHPIVLRNRPAHVYRVERIITAMQRMHHPEQTPATE